RRSGRPCGWVVIMQTLRPLFTPRRIARAFASLAVLALLGHFVYANAVALHEARMPIHAAAPAVADDDVLALAVAAAYDELGRLPGSAGVSIAWDSHLIAGRGVSGSVLHSSSPR